MKSVLRLSALCGVLLVSADAFAQETAKVQVTIKVSDKTPSFMKRRLVVMLYHNNLQEDERKVTVDRHIDATFSHEKGKETVVTLTLGQKATLKRDLRYSVNATVFEGASTRTHVGRADGREGPIPVLTYGSPGKIAMILTPIP